MSGVKRGPRYPGVRDFRKRLKHIIGANSIFSAECPCEHVGLIVPPGGRGPTLSFWFRRGKPHAECLLIRRNGSRCSERGILAAVGLPNAFARQGGES